VNKKALKRKKAAEIRLKNTRYRSHLAIQVELLKLIGEILRQNVASLTAKQVALLMECLLNEAVVFALSRTHIQTEALRQAQLPPTPPEYHSTFQKGGSITIALCALKNSFPLLLNMHSLAANKREMAVAALEQPCRLLMLEFAALSRTVDSTCKKRIDEQQELLALIRKQQIDFLKAQQNRSTHSIPTVPKILMQCLPEPETSLSERKLEALCPLLTRFLQLLAEFEFEHLQGHLEWLYDPLVQLVEVDTRAIRVGAQAVLRRLNPLMIEASKAVQQPPQPPSPEEPEQEEKEPEAGSEDSDELDDLI